ncbi:DUF3408 domain-containing protein [Dysgonomonas sp. HDW5B]|uniref:DUF3408 domain-containing protein n=1 Tax=Dysgonomonas sp. HDW5B TaxID=2714927 RepID=UPI00140A3F94|nr:DUF3408 domain-containing protein [Dysgonomonas sp. HDW5B]QIK55714.1 DUF3408 domain-containing protein [Dysgonomonas sp. HDW5B]
MKNKKEVPSDFNISEIMGEVSRKQTFFSEESKESLPTSTSEPISIDLPNQTIKQRSSTKQRKSGLLDYQQTFLVVPKITDRKTVFISNELRERVVDIVRKLGTEKSSVSGFIENLAIHHLEEYKDDVETWKKL